MAKSIMTALMGYCFICGNAASEVHHIFHGTANRKLSEKYGLTVPLCHRCHNEPPDGVHFNRENDLALKRAGESMFRLKYPDLDFVEVFGKSYLGIANEDPVETVAENIELEE